MAGEEEIVTEAESIATTKRNWKYSESPTGDQVKEWLEGIKEGNVPEIARSEKGIYGIEGISELDIVDSVTHATSDFLNTELGKSLIKREMVESGSPPDLLQEITDDLQEHIKGSALYGVEICLKGIGRYLTKEHLPATVGDDNTFRVLSIDAADIDEPVEKVYTNGLAGKAISDTDDLLDFPVEFVSRKVLLDKLGFAVGLDGKVANETPFVPSVFQDKKFTDVVEIIPSVKKPGIYLEISHSYVNDPGPLQKGRINRDGLCLIQETIIVEDPKEVKKHFDLSQKPNP